MRSSLFAVCCLATVLTLPAHLRAQSTDSSDPGQRAEAARQKMIGFLPPADQTRVTSVYNKAMTDNPKLKSEGEDLGQEGMEMKNATEEHRHAFMEQVRVHREKVRMAMLKEDPSIEPILNKIDKHMSDMWAEHQKAMSNSDDSGQ